jgi:protease IV
MTFLKNFFASCLGSLVALLVLFLLVIVLLTGIVGSVSTPKEVAVEDNSVLHLRSFASITELEQENPFEELFPSSEDQSVGLIKLKQTIKHAKDDSKIKGIYLNVGQIQAGLVTVEEVRESILDFRQSGKWVIAYSDFFTEGAYYLATAADKIYMYPEGQVEFNGLASDIMFFKNMLDKLEIKAEVFKVGDFKSAVEPFIRENMSDENRLQLNSLLGSIHGEMLQKVSDARGIPKTKLKEIADKMRVQSANDAVTYKLIDSLLYDDQIKDDFRNRLGLKKDEKISLVKYGQYKRSFSSYETSENEVAVIVADGEIMLGQSTDGTVGSTTIMKELSKARANSKVKAIVLRINSPGGVFQAGDQMWREITLAAKEKPVIASMGDLAASGGYYMAMACDTIVAQPTTITGSIGVFAVLFDLSKFLNNKIGITTEEVKTGEVSEPSMIRPLNEIEKSIFQKQVDGIYETFTSKAAGGRRMSQDDIKKIASGRVWSGTQAKDNGLVDVLGNLEDAIRIAAQKGKVEKDYKLKFYPQPKSFFERFVGEIEQNTRARILQNELGDQLIWYNQWEQVKSYQGVQTRLPWNLKLN